MNGNWHEEIHRRGDRAHVGSRVDGVCGQKREDHGVEESARVVLAENPGEPHAADQADPGADELDRGHRGERQEGRPEEGESERGAGRRIGADARRIVVCASGDEPGTEQLEEASDRVTVGSVHEPG